MTPGSMLLNDHALGLKVSAGGSLNEAPGHTYLTHDHTTMRCARRRFKLYSSQFWWSYIRPYPSLIRARSNTLFKAAVWLIVYVTNPWCICTQFGVSNGITRGCMVQYLRPYMFSNGGIYKCWPEVPLYFHMTTFIWWRAWGFKGLPHGFLRIHVTNVFKWRTVFIHFKPWLYYMVLHITILLLHLRDFYMRVGHLSHIHLTMNR
jgi:hypothetical protein